MLVLFNKDRGGGHINDSILFSSLQDGVLSFMLMFLLKSQRACMSIIHWMVSSSLLFAGIVNVILLQIF